MVITKLRNGSTIEILDGNSVRRFDKPATGLLAHLQIQGALVSSLPESRRRGQRMIEAERLFNKEWAISKSALAALVADFIVVRTAAQGFDDSDEDDYCPYLLTEDGIACIPVSGPLTKARYWRGTSYGDIGLMCAHAISNSSVKAILLCFDSPGGEVSGMFELTDYLSSLRGQKPIAAISDDNCYSAAYCLAAATDQIFATQTGGTGSIGCWTAHVDYSKMLSMEGVQITYVFSGAKKVDGNPTESLPDRVRADMQEETDRIRAMFVQSVAKSRGVSADALMETEAGVFMAEAGIPLLCDRIGTVEDALAYLRAQVGVAAPSGQSDQELVNSLPESDDDGQDNAHAKTTHALLSNLPCLSSRFRGESLESVDRGGIRSETARVRAEECAGRLLNELTALRKEHGDQVEARILHFAGSQSDAGDSRKITITAVPYGDLSTDLGGFREIYQPGCFKDGLSNDPRAVFDHDYACILGRVSAGTARFWEDADGVHVECEAPETQWANDLLVSMRRKDITGASAAFFILKQRWQLQDGERVRIVERALMREASVYSFPAYESTQAAVSGQPAAEAVEAEAAVLTGLEVTELDRARLELLTLR